MKNIFVRVEFQMRVRECEHLYGVSVFIVFSALNSRLHATVNAINAYFLKSSLDYRLMQLICFQFFLCGFFRICETEFFKFPARNVHVELVLRGLFLPLLRAWTLGLAMQLRMVGMPSNALCVTRDHSISKMRTCLFSVTPCIWKDAIFTQWFCVIITRGVY